MLGIGGESNAVRPKVPCKQPGCAALVEPGNKYCEMLESVEKVPTSYLQKPGRYLISSREIIL